MTETNKLAEYELPQNDFMFKRLFGYEGNEEITKDLISSIIGEKINKLEFKNPYLLREISTDKEETLDVRAELDNKILCDIEIQVTNNHDIIKRVLDYWSKMYRAEMGKGKDYDSLKRTIVILITTFNIEELKGVESYSTTWKIIEEKLTIQLTDLFEIDILELPKAKKQIRKGTFKRTDQNDWIKFIIDPVKMEVLKMDNLKEEIKKAYEIWQNTELTEKERDIAERRYMDLRSAEYGRQYERKLGEERGEKRGRKIGRKEGREEGRKEGKQEGKLEDAKKMLEMEMDIETIVEVTGLSEEEIEKL